MDFRSRDSYYHQVGAEPLFARTIDQCFGAVVERFGDREALVSRHQGRRLRYAELDREVDRLARGLLALGLGQGSRLGVWSTDHLEWIVLQLATARVGVVLVNINPAYRLEELRHALRKARVEAVFTIPAFRSSHYVEMLLELCPEARTATPAGFAAAQLPDLRHIVVWDPRDAWQTVRPAPGLRTWREVIELGALTTVRELRERARALDPDDPINIQFTSGTTGLPKAVVLTHHGLLNNAWAIGAALQLTAADRLCVPVPFYHCFGMVVSNLACLIRAAAVVIPAEHFDPAATLAAVQDERCTVMHGVPTMFVALFEQPTFADHDLSSLRTGIMAGAPCPETLMRRVIDDLGCAGILIGYGMTEASPVTHTTHLDDELARRVGTVGSNLPHTEVKVVDTGTGAMVRRGDKGEVCVRGYHVMRGYFDDPAATAEAIDAAGWLHTGDIGVLDDDGYLRITGRLKNMIIRGGENIYPAEIEAFFFAHPKVADIAVFGIPDPRVGEEVGAWIQLHDGQTADPEEFRAWARDRIAHYKVPRHVWIVDEFPMTVTGKVQKFRIREIVAAQMAAATAASGRWSDPMVAGSDAGLPSGDPES